MAALEPVLSAAGRKGAVRCGARKWKLQPSGRSRGPGPRNEPKGAAPPTGSLTESAGARFGWWWDGTPTGSLTESAGTRRWMVVGTGRRAALGSLALRGAAADGANHLQLGAARD